MSVLHELKDDFQRAEALINLLIDRATGGPDSEQAYFELRMYFLENPEFSPLLPQWIGSQRSLNQFWSYIKNKFSTYKERRDFLWQEFEPLLKSLETGKVCPAEDDIDQGITVFNSDEVSRSWSRMTQRLAFDPEGAITSSRQLLESVIKHILDECGIIYDKGSDLPVIFKAVQSQLNLAPEQHQEELFKQVLRGCAGVVNGLGAIRNNLGDAHGSGRLKKRPEQRHARLVVSLAGSMALFLIETHLAKVGSLPKQAPAPPAEQAIW